MTVSLPRVGKNSLHDSETTSRIAPVWPEGLFFVPGVLVIPLSFADLLRTWLDGRPPSSPIVARKLRCTTRCVRFWLSGHSIPTAPRLPKLARIMRRVLPRGLAQLRQLIASDRAARAVAKARAS
jgi:hypothetical protein